MKNIYKKCLNIYTSDNNWLCTMLILTQISTNKEKMIINIYI